MKAYVSRHFLNSCRRLAELGSVDARVAVPRVCPDLREFRGSYWAEFHAEFSEFLDHPFAFFALEAPAYDVAAEYLFSFTINNL